MYRSGWATKEGQERILAVRLGRQFFDEILQKAVVSRFDPQLYSNQEDWRAAVANSDVRLQWDPDHDPYGISLTRRAIQLGLRGQTLSRYGKNEIISISDITEFVAEQRNNLIDGFKNLLVPKELIYPAPAFYA